MKTSGSRLSAPAAALSVGVKAEPADVPFHVEALVNRLTASRCASSPTPLRPSLCGDPVVRDVFLVPRGR